MDNHLLLQKGNRIYLLVKYPDRYHIVTVNNALDEAAEEKLLSGSCSDAVIDEMGLSRQTVLRKELRGVAVGGCTAGDVIVFYVKDRKKDQKLKYVLSDDYADEEMEAFFAGVTRFQPPKNSGSGSRKADWRKGLQDESTRERMKPVGAVLNAAGVVCFLCTGFWGRLSTLWTAACLIVMTVSLTFYFAWPQYFSLMDSKEYKRAGYTARVERLWLPIAGPGLALVLRLFDFYFPNWMPLLIAGVAVGVVFSAAACAFSREIRENTSTLIVVLLLAVFISSGVIGQVNHLFNFSPDAPQTCTVTETERVSGGKHADHYYCTVLLGSGEEMRIPITAADYRTLELGDTVMVAIDQGLFGIEYVYFVGEE